MKRLKSLKRKFIRDKSFHEMNKAFIDEMLEKGYARKGENGQIGKVWYIPHYRVTHPAKPGDLWVVFDCSAEFAGTVFSKQLIVWPDLINQLVCAFTRLRKEHTAYMADIEAMFQKSAEISMVGVWWPKNGSWGIWNKCLLIWKNIITKLQQPRFQKNICWSSNRAWKNDAKTLHKNVYVNDMLKSPLDVRTAIGLISRVRGFVLLKVLT